MGKKTNAGKSLLSKKANNEESKQGNVGESSLREQIPDCCEGCDLWMSQGKKCWYFWEGKKDCTMHSDN